MARVNSLSGVAVCVLCCLVAWPAQGQSPPEPSNRLTASGLLKPVGPPTTPPSRTDAGTCCIVDLEQQYLLSGTLAGAATIDYRILVHGPCGSAPGTFPEEWIAHGRIKGTLDGVEVSGGMSYLADVKTGGDVSGSIVLGQGMDGELHVSGNFADGHLSYTGWVRSR